MSASSTTAVTTTRYGHAFWEFMWRSAGIQSAGLFIIAYFICGNDGDRTRTLIAAAISGLAILNLMWFAAAIRTTLADAGQGGWGSAATASSAAVGASLLLLITIGAALAYSISGSADREFTSSLDGIVSAGFVMSSFPRAMLIMSGSLGLWRAGLISNGLFTLGVAAIVLVLAGGTTWLDSGFWSPEGVYSCVVSPVIGLIWVVVVSVLLLVRIPGSRSGW